MSKLQRLKPDPIPAIHPLPEYAVEGERARWYREMKQALQVPWMGVVTMAYAHYPTFFRGLWRGLKPLVVSRPFVDAARGLQTLAESRASELSPPAIVKRLSGLGYSEREIAAIRQSIEVFSHGNHLYALIATIARMLMEGGEMAGPIDDVTPVFNGRHAPDVSVLFVLMEPHHADESTRATFDDVKAVLGLPFVNTDYRAFARWPSYWSMAWTDLRAVVGTRAHDAICDAYHDQLAEAAARTLPNPGGLRSAALRKAAADDADIVEIVRMCQLFQWLLPGLATNVAFLKAGLAR